MEHEESTSHNADTSLQEELQNARSVISNLLSQLEQKVATQKQSRKRKRDGEEDEDEENPPKRLRIVAPNDKHLVSLNVGGERFLTTLESLTKDKNSFFAGMFDVESGILPNSEEEYFIDRNPTHFQLILDHLRGYNVRQQIDSLTDIEKQLLEDDVDFYNIQSMFFLLPRLYTRQHQLGRVACSSYDKVIKIWDLNTMECQKTITLNSSARIMLYMGDEHLLLGQCNGVIRSWNITANHCVSTWSGHTKKIVTLTKIDDARFASGSMDKNIKIWSFNTQQCLLTLTGHDHVIRDLLVMSETKMLSASEDKTVRMWDINTGECTKVVTHEKYVTSLLKLSADRYLTGGAALCMNIWDLSNECHGTFQGHKGCILTVKKYGNDSLISTSTDNTVKVWDINTMKCINTLRGHTHDVRTGVVINQYAVLSGSRDTTLRLWNTETSEDKIIDGHKKEILNAVLLE
jgi:WD40 repeat protein